MALRDAAAMLWERTDLKPSDVGVAGLYDGFSFITMAWLEALGFCKKGEGGPFIEGGQRIARDGEIPLNTHGGQLSAGRLHGEVVGVDISPAMVEAAARRAAAAGVMNARFVATNAETEALGSEFDAAYSRFGVMFFADPAAGFANIGRSLRSRGRVGCAVWAP